MSLRCWFGWHAHAVRDRDAAGRQVLRCVRCWRVRSYLPVDLAAIRAKRLAQLDQAKRLQAKAVWRSKV